jgi:hypothetical protein
MVADGVRDAAALRRAAAGALRKIAPVDEPRDPAARIRMNELADLSQRIASANRAAQAPAIDGNTDDRCWQWNGQTPWVMRNSSMPFPFATDVAFAYDDKHLYVALRCRDQDRAAYDFYWEQRGKAATEYGFRTKDTPSVHIYLDPAGMPGEAGGGMTAYQVVPNVYGGLWEKYKAVESCRTVWDPDANEWRTEMAIGWDSLHVDPATKPAFRLNVVRYVRKQWHRNTGGWYLSHEWVRAHDAQENERGWLVLE